MTLTKWDPFRDMEEWLLDRPGAERKFFWPQSAEHKEWAPVVDISETDTEYLIKAELPDIPREDIKITIEDRALTLSGERKTEMKDKKMHRVERYFGRFFRSFTLPDHVIKDKIKANFKNGMLILHLPKRAEAKHKEIEVKID